MATKYRCYLINGDSIVAVQVIEGSDDAAAVLEANRILQSSLYSTAELWDRYRRVSIISRKEMANPAAG
jgi:hypothetical protein